MAQQIMDYAAFFAGAKQAVEEVEQLKQKERQLENDEKQQENALKAKQKAVSDTISQTVKARKSELSKSYDAEINKLQDQLKKVRAKREKARTQGVKERIAEDTKSLVAENGELQENMKRLFRERHVPGFCRSNFYYSLYFTRSIREAVTLFLAVFVCFVLIPCGIYFLLPDRKTWYLAAVYVADVLVFGGLYVTVGNMTKVRHLDTLKEGRQIRSQIFANKKQVKKIAKSVRKDKNEAIYNLQKFDDEIAQLNQDLEQVNRQKKEALNTFESVTKTIISDEITGNYKAELDALEQDLEHTVAALRETKNSMKEKALFITDQYEVYIGKEFMTLERLTALEEIVRNQEASNVTEAIAVYRKKAEQPTS